MSYETVIKVIQATIIATIIGGFSKSSFAGTDDLYFTKAKSEISGQQALLKGLQGEEIYHCKLETAALNKTGRGASLKAKKKALTKEQAEQQIEELKKRVEK